MTLPSLPLVVQSSSRPVAGLRVAATRKRKPGAALATDCQMTIAECEYPRTATDMATSRATPKTSFAPDSTAAPGVVASKWRRIGTDALLGRNEIRGFAGQQLARATRLATSGVTGRADDDAPDDAGNEPAVATGRTR